MRDAAPDAGTNFMTRPAAAASSYLRDRASKSSAGSTAIPSPMVQGRCSRIHGVPAPESGQLRRGGLFRDPARSHVPAVAVREQACRHIVLSLPGWRAGDCQGLAKKWAMELA